MTYLLPHTIFASANTTPDKEAFKCGRNSLTYAQLAEQVQQLAATLWEVGVRKGDRVAVFLNRSIETVVAIHGIMHAGAAYVPLNPKAPAAQNLRILKDSDSKVAVSNKAQQTNLGTLLGDDITVQTVIGCPDLAGKNCISWDAVKTAPTSFSPPARILETDLAYLMYTSGSTGAPKGMMHTHASGLAFARLMADTFQLNSNDRFGNHAPIYFDISTLAYFTAPLVGGSAVIASDAHTIFPGSMSSLIEKEELTVWYSVPLALTQILHKGMPEQRDFSRLRRIFYAGEPFAPKYLRELMAHCPNAQVANLYGPAETNVCTYYDLPGPPKGDEPIAIGEVWNNTDRILLNEDGQEVISEGTGELCIRSTTMMQGYWQRPDLNEKAFLRRVTPGGATERYYKTGDLVRLENDNMLHFIGRKDNQVKVRGYRIELDAVESRLLAHPAVAEVAAITETSEEETLRLVALVILKENQEVAAPELSTFTGKSLPWYAVPERFEFMTDFPRTGSGKIDRPALKRMNQNL